MQQKNSYRKENRFIVLNMGGKKEKKKKILQGQAEIDIREVEVAFFWWAKSLK